MAALRYGKRLRINLFLSLTAWYDIQKVVLLGNLETYCKRTIRKIAQIFVSLIARGLLRKLKTKSNQQSTVKKLAQYYYILESKNDRQENEQTDILYESPEAITYDHRVDECPVSKRQSNRQHSNLMGLQVGKGLLKLSKRISRKENNICHRSSSAPENSIQKRNRNATTYNRAFSAPQDSNFEKTAALAPDRNIGASTRNDHHIHIHSDTQTNQTEKRPKSVHCAEPQTTSKLSRLEGTTDITHFGHKFHQSSTTSNDEGKTAFLQEFISNITLSAAHPDAKSGFTLVPPARVYPEMMEKSQARTASFRIPLDFSEEFISFLEMEEKMECECSNKPCNCDFLLFEGTDKLTEEELCKEIRCFTMRFQKMRPHFKQERDECLVQKHSKGILSFPKLKNLFSELVASSERHECPKRLEVTENNPSGNTDSVAGRFGGEKARDDSNLGNLIPSKISRHDTQNDTEFSSQDSFRREFLSVAYIENPNDDKEDDELTQQFYDAGVIAPEIFTVSLIQNRMKKFPMNKGRKNILVETSKATAKSNYDHNTFDRFDSEEKLDFETLKRVNDTHLDDEIENENEYRTSDDGIELVTRQVGSNQSSLGKSHFSTLEIYTSESTRSSLIHGKLLFSTLGKYTISPTSCSRNIVPDEQNLNSNIQNSKMRPKSHSEDSSGESHFSTLKKYRSKSTASETSQGRLHFSTLEKYPNKSNSSCSSKGFDRRFDIAGRDSEESTHSQTKGASLENQRRKLFPFQLRMAM